MGQRPRDFGVTMACCGVPIHHPREDYFRSESIIFSHTNKQNEAFRICKNKWFCIIRALYWRCKQRKSGNISGSGRKLDRSLPVNTIVSIHWTACVNHDWHESSPWEVHLCIQIISLIGVPLSFFRGGFMMFITRHLK